MRREKGKSGDLRRQMHPAVRSAVPNTPEAIAISQRETLKPMPFGHFLTKMVELEVIEGKSLDDIRGEVAEYFGVPEHQFASYLGEPKPMQLDFARRILSHVKTRKEQAFRRQQAEVFQERFTERVLDELGPLRPEVVAAQVAEREELVDRLKADLNARALGPRMRAEGRLPSAERELESARTSRFAISLPELAQLVKTDEDERSLSGLGSVLQGLDLVYPSDVWWDWCEGETEGWSEEKRQNFESTMLIESDLKEIAEDVAHHKFKDKAGDFEQTVIDPVYAIEQVLFVTEMDKVAFAQAYPTQN